MWLNLRGYLQKIQDTYMFVNFLKWFSTFYEDNENIEWDLVKLHL